MSKKMKLMGTALIAFVLMMGLSSCEDQTVNMLLGKWICTSQREIVSENGKVVMDTTFTEDFNGIVEMRFTEDGNVIITADDEYQVTTYTYNIEAKMLMIDQTEMLMGGNRKTQQDGLMYMPLTIEELTKDKLVLSMEYTRVNNYYQENENEEPTVITMKSIISFTR